MLTVVLSLSGTTRAELWVANAACGFHAGLLAPGHNWNGPKQSELKKKGIYWVKCLNVGLWTLVSCPRLSHNQLCVLIVPLALLGSDWSISRLHVKFLLTLSGSWRYQLFSPASLVASKASQAPAGAAITTTTTIVCPPKGALCYLIHSGQMPFTDKSPQHLTVYVHIFNLLHHHLSWFNCSFFFRKLHEIVHY